MKEVRDILQLELSLKMSIIGIGTYSYNTSNWMLRLVKSTRKINACTLLLAMQKVFK